MNNKLKISIIIITVLLIGVYVLLVFVVTPSEDSFILSHNVVDSEIKLGDTINVNASLKNKTYLTYFAHQGFNFLGITFKPDNGEEVVFLPVAQPKIIMMRENYKRSLIIEPTEIGDYEIVFVAAFSIRGKQYWYTDTVKITVVA